MAQQTAVNWILIELQNKFYKEMGNMYNTNQFLFESLFEQAKAMEKQQIMQAVYDSMGTNFDPNMGRAELYYNEKYKTK